MIARPKHPDQRGQPVAFALTRPAGDDIAYAVQQPVNPCDEPGLVPIVASTFLRGRAPAVPPGRGSRTGIARPGKRFVSSCFWRGKLPRAFATPAGLAVLGRSGLAATPPEIQPLIPCGHPTNR